MCGISGLINIQSRFQVERLKQIGNSLTESLHHRGPDHREIYIHPEQKFLFCHNRLSIIDLSQENHQPFISTDKKFILIYNGEIYNYLELKKLCLEQGSQFRTEGDTEVLVECFRHFGPDCLKMFRGMFSFILYDFELKKYFIARDIFGIKPLFYSFIKGAFIFSSEIKALNILDPALCEIDDITLKLFRDKGFSDRGDWTFFRHINQFPPAHYYYGKISEKDFNSQGKISVTKYFDPYDELKSHLQEDKTNLHDSFKESIELHLRSDVKIGFCLSGGVDSSSILGMTAKLKQKEGLRLDAYTTSFPEYKNCDESNFAKLVADQTKANHHLVIPDREKFFAKIQHMLHVQDEPFQSASIFSQYCLFEQMSQDGQKVVLDGQGGDEIFLGYHSRIEVYFIQLIRQFKVLTFMTEVIRWKKIYPINLFNIFKGILLSLIKPAKNPLYWHELNLPDTKENRLKFLSFKEYNIETYFIRLLFESNIPKLCRYEDRNSMAFSIESRVPFLDRVFALRGISSPLKNKIKFPFLKANFRESMGGVIPDLVKNRQDKFGFNTPSDEWLKEKGVDQSWRNFIISEWLKMVKNRLDNNQDLLH